MKVLHIIAGLDVGGTEMGLYRLLSRLGPAYHPHVISLSTIGEAGKHIQELDIPVQALGMKPGVPDPLVIIHLALTIKKMRPDLVHTWMYHANLIGGLASRMAGVPILTWEIRNGDLPVDKTKWTTRAVMRIGAKLSRRLPHCIISCSHAARAIHVALGYDDARFVIIPNGFDLLCLRPDPVAGTEVRQELGVPAGAPVIGLVARFDPQKNHQGFFEAAGILHATRPDVHFVLAGNAIETNNHQVAAWARNNGVERVTHLLGLRDDIPRLTASFDIATSSSWSEAFPNVVGEAMACGVPCVVTDVGDSAYIVSDTGVVVKPGEAHSLAAAWLKLLALSPKERLALGERARTRVAERFELGSVVRRYETMYEELAGVKSGKNQQ